MNKKILSALLIGAFIAEADINLIYTKNIPNNVKENMGKLTTITNEEPEKTKKRSADEILQQSLTRKYKSNNLEKTLTDWSVNPAKNFTVKDNFPKILKKYKGKDKDELMKKYQIIWNYDFDAVYWVIEKMRKISEDSQDKLEHYGMQNYLEKNISDKMFILDYALELYIKKREPKMRKINELALKSQKALQILAEENPAPIININPVNYLSDECIKTRGGIILSKVKDNLRLFNSSEQFDNYKDLIKNTYTSEQYREFLREVIKTNKSYFEAINKSRKELPFIKKWTYPFVKSEINGETENAYKIVVELCNILYKETYGKKREN